MTKCYLIVLIVVSLLSSLWSAEHVQSDDKPVSFLGITMGEYIPQGAAALIKVPKGFDGCAVAVSPLTRRITEVTLTRNLSDEDKATHWVDTLVSGLALSSNADLSHTNNVYRFTKGRVHVTVCQIGITAYVKVSDINNDGIHSVIGEARGWSPTAPLLPTAPATK